MVVLKKLAKIFKNIFFIEHLRTTASVNIISAKNAKIIKLLILNRLPFRSSSSHMFFKIGVLKIFAKFTVFFQTLSCAGVLYRSFLLCRIKKENIFSSD